MKHIIHFITQLFYTIVQPTTPVLCPIPVETTHKRYFVGERQHAHERYKHGNVVWRENVGEPR
jgi:hypothetical protein